MRIRFSIVGALLFSIGLLFAASTASAVTVTGWWRMEADNDPGSGYSIANEVLNGSTLIGTSGNIQAGVPVNPLPQPPMLPNNFALSGDNEINGEIANYSGLNPTSATIEFFARSNEGDARFVLRQSGTTGLRIDQPNNLRVQYSTTSGQETLAPGTINFDANYDHIAFTYDEFSGISHLYLNGVSVADNTGNATPGATLTWPSAPLLVGNGVDGGSGLIDAPIFDELRITDAALLPSQFLTGSVAAPALAVLPDPPVELVRFNFDTLAGRGASNIAPEIVDSGIVSNPSLSINPAVVGGSNGSDLTFEISNQGYATDAILRVFPAGNTNETAATANDGYFEFTVEADGGASLDLHSLVFDAARGGGGTRGWGVRTSADGFLSLLDTDTIPTQRPTFTQFTVDLSDAMFQGVGDPLTFRVYVFSPGDGSTVEFDNLRLVGSLTSVPEPATATLGLMALGGMMLRRRRKA